MARTEAEVKKIIDQYVDYLERDLKVSKVILFGSYAKGTASDDSDIDIAVESPDFSDDYFARRRN